MRGYDNWVTTPPDYLDDEPEPEEWPEEPDDPREYALWLAEVREIEAREADFDDNSWR